MLVVDSLVNPKKQSGYDYVTRAHSTGSKTELWCARKGMFNAGTAATDWHGPCRRSPADAAQDYCDYVNGSNAHRPAPLRPSAGHAINKRKRKIHPKRAEAYRLLAEARADESKSDDASGYIYCIGEKGQPPAYARVKLGKSKDDPIYRLAGLQTGNSRILYVVASKKVANRHAAEKRLHDRFAAHCCTNEWFWAADILDEVLAQFNIRSDATS